MRCSRQSTSCRITTSFVKQPRRSIFSCSERSTRQWIHVSWSVQLLSWACRQEIQLELHFKTSSGHGKSASRSPNLGYNCTSFSQTNLWNSSVIFLMKLGIPVLCATFSSFFILLYICDKRHKKAMPTSHQLASETGRMYILRFFTVFQNWELICNMVLLKKTQQALNVQKETICTWCMCRSWVSDDLLHLQECMMSSAVLCRGPCTTDDEIHLEVTLDMSDGETLDFHEL